MQVFLFILKNLGEYKKLFYIVAVVSLINGAASFYIPVTLAEFANNPLRSGGFGFTVMLIIGLYVVSLIASYVVRGQGEALSKNYANLIRLKYFQEFSILSLGKLRKKHSGYMQSLVNRVADGLTAILFAFFWNLLPGMLLVVLFFTYMARESILLALLNLFIMSGFVIVSGVLARKMIPIAAEQNRRNATLLGSYADFTANISTVVQLGIRSYAQSVLGDHATKSNQQTDALQQFHARRWFLLHALFGLAYLSTIGFLIWQISLGGVTIGLLILFVSAYGMMRAQIESLSENVKSFMEIKAYLHELEDIIGQPVGNSHARKKTSWRNITMKNISFKHQGGGDTIFIPSFSISAKQKICIEGKSGQGKSTLLGLLTNAFHADSGERHVDDVPYEMIGRSFFENHIAVVAQEAELFHMSVRDNLTLGRHVNDKTLLDYLDELEMREWIKNLDNGLDTIIGEKGVTLSAGQRQRLNILRAIILNRSLYILDEPTSHLDAHTEATVVTFLRKQLADKAIVIVTHRPALRSICDISYEMKNHRLLLK
jgi:ABC-type bacteriocin/lantibiotic exporter with double-glycine peptidase domain